MRHEGLPTPSNLLLGSPDFASVMGRKPSIDHSFSQTVDEAFRNLATKHQLGKSSDILSHAAIRAMDRMISVLHLLTVRLSTHTSILSHFRVCPCCNIGVVGVWLFLILLTITTTSVENKAVRHRYRLPRPTLGRTVTWECSDEHVGFDFRLAIFCIVTSRSLFPGEGGVLPPPSRLVYRYRQC